MPRRAGGGHSWLVACSCVRSGTAAPPLSLVFPAPVTPMTNVPAAQAVASSPLPPDRGVRSVFTTTCLQTEGYVLSSPLPASRPRGTFYLHPNLPPDRGVRSTLTPACLQTEGSVLPSPQPASSPRGTFYPHHTLSLDRVVRSTLTTPCLQAEGNVLPLPHPASRPRGTFCPHPSLPPDRGVRSTFNTHSTADCPSCGTNYGPLGMVAMLSTRGYSDTIQIGERSEVP